MLRIKRRLNAPPVQPWNRKRVAAPSIAVSPASDQYRIPMSSVLVAATSWVDKEQGFRSKSHVATEQAPMKSLTDERKFRPVIDTLVALAIASTPFFNLYVDEWSDPNSSSSTFAWTCAIALLIGGPLLVRRRFPIAALGLLLLASVGAEIAGGEGRRDPDPDLDGSCALYRRHHRVRRAAVAAGVISALIAVAVEVLTEPGAIRSLDSLMQCSGPHAPLRPGTLSAHGASPCRS